MKIYTRSGDFGQTGLYGGARVGKDSPRVAAIGAVDELNAVLGVAAATCEEGLLRDRVQRVQSMLFDIGAELGSDPDSDRKITANVSRWTTELEVWIDAQSAELPELRQFILPGGTLSAANVHVARSVCRRAERDVIALSKIEEVRQELIVFLNRLSDWLFVTARTVNQSSGQHDIRWEHVEE